MSRTQASDAMTSRLPRYSNAFSTLSFSFTKMLNATNEIVAADAAADNNSNSSSDDISDMTSHSHALIDSDSPAQILK